MAVSAFENSLFKREEGHVISEDEYLTKKDRNVDVASSIGWTVFEFPNPSEWSLALVRVIQTYKR
jgi:hypothetical protein